MAKAKNKKALTLRQRLREQGEEQLEGMLQHATQKVEGVCKRTNIDPALLMQLASQPTRSKTLRHQLVTILTNQKEAELEKLYNDQLTLPIPETKQ